MILQPTFTLAHISDLHLDPMPKAKWQDLVGKRAIGHFNWHRSRKKIHPRQILDKLVGDLKSQQADHIAITGDIVNIGLPEEFENALSWLENLGEGKDISVVPGNHDNYVQMAQNHGFLRWHHFMQNNEDAAPFLASGQNHFPFLRLFGKVALIGLSSAIPTAPFIAAGKLGEAQSHALKHILQKLGEGGFYRIVMLHHPPFVQKGQWMHGLRDAKNLTKLLHNTGAELVLHGHTHKHMIRSMKSDHGDIPVIGVPSASQFNHLRNPDARYNLYKIRPTQTGWQMDMTSHGITGLAAPIKQLDQQQFISKH